MADFESRYVIHSKGEKAAELAARLAKEPDMKRPPISREKSGSDDLRADEAKEDVAVAEADSTEAKKDTAADVVKTAHDGEKPEVVAQTVRVAPLEAKKAAAAEAVNSVSPENKVKVAAEGVEQLSPTQQKELVDRLPITPVTADEIWRTVVGAFKWVLWGATLGLIGISGLAAFRNVDLANILIMLTVFTTTAGILAGFLGGQAVDAIDTTESSVWSQVFKAFKWVLVISTLALVAAIGVAFFREVDQDQVLIQSLLTVFTTVAGILAGFLGGRATSGKGQDS
jgi:hypothetical protein